MSARWAAGRQEVAAGLWASLEVSWAIEGSSGVAGCSGVQGHAGGDGAVTASLEANCVSVRWAVGRWEVVAGLWASLEVGWAMGGSSSVGGCSRVQGQAGGDGAVAASLEANRVSARQAAGRQ